MKTEYFKEDKRIFFSISLHQPDSFKYLDGEATKPMCNDYPRSVYSEYCSIKIQRNVSRKDIMNDDDRNQLRQLAGQMLWASSQTRPDMAFEDCMIFNTGKSSSIKRIVKAKKVITTLKIRSLQLTFNPTNVAKKIEILSYSDATHASLDQGASHGTRLIAIKAKDGVNPTCCQSNKLDRFNRNQ